MRACGKAFVERGDGRDLLVAGENAALELEIVEAIACLRGLGEAHDGLRGQRLFVAQPRPVVLGVRLFAIGKIGLAAVADIEQIAEHLDTVALLALAEQGGDRHAEELAEQIEHRGFDGGDHVDGGAQVEGLQAAAAGVAIGELAPDGVEHRLPCPDGPADDESPRILERLADLLAARHLADADMAGIVLQDEDVAGEERPVRARQVEQHGVVPGDRNDPHLRDHGRSGYGGRDGISAHEVTPVNVGSGMCRGLWCIGRSTPRPRRQNLQP